MSATRATFAQFINARTMLGPVNAKFAKHLDKVWNEARGHDKKALIERTQADLIDRFGLADGAARFAKAMGESA